MENKKKSSGLSTNPQKIIYVLFGFRGLPLITIVAINEKLTYFSARKPNNTTSLSAVDLLIKELK